MALMADLIPLFMGSSLVSGFLVLFDAVLKNVDSAGASKSTLMVGRL